MEASRMANQSAQATRKQLIEDARAAALAGNWAEAITVNQAIVERTPRDADAYNRMGRAYLEQHDYAAATDAYTQALKNDKANIIARRNLQRLELLRKSTGDTTLSGASAPRSAVFIEEVGRTWVDELLNSLDLEQLALVSPGEQLQLENVDGRLFVTTAKGKRLGEIESKTAERVIMLMANGNQYEVYALGISSRSLRVILREVYRDLRNGALVSFPRQVSATRAYLRERDSLRARDESEFILLDDDDDHDDDAQLDTSDDDDASDNESDSFMDDSLPIDDEDSGM
jgi:hypothetical protein